MDYLWIIHCWLSNNLPISIWLNCRRLRSQCPVSTLDWLPNFPHKALVDPGEGSFTCLVSCSELSGDRTVIAGGNFNCLPFWRFPPAYCLVQSLKAISWFVNCIIQNPKRIIKFKLLVHNSKMLKNGKLLKNVRRQFATLFERKVSSDLEGFYLFGKLCCRFIWSEREETFQKGSQILIKWNWNLNIDFGI